MRDQDAAARAAIFEDDVAALRAALRRGANVNGMVAGQGAGTDGMPFESTILGFAANLGHEACLRVLIAEGADLNVPAVFRDGSVGPNALHESAHRDRVACVRVLLDAGVDVDSRTGNGWTALHTACEQGHQHLVELLMRYGADITMENKGYMPLFLALHAGHRQIVLTMLRAGAPCQVLTSDMLADYNKELNDFVIRDIINAGGWERVVERHRRPLLGVLSRLALPHDALPVILSFWSPPGGFR